MARLERLVGATFDRGVGQSVPVQGNRIKSAQGLYSGKVDLPEGVLITSAVLPEGAKKPFALRSLRLRPWKHAANCRAQASRRADRQRQSSRFQSREAPMALARTPRLLNFRMYLKKG